MPYQDWIDIVEPTLENKSKLSILEFGLGEGTKYLLEKFKFKSVAIADVLFVPPVVRKTNLVEVAASIPTAAPDATTAKADVEAVVVFVATGIVPVESMATVLKFVGSAVIALKFWV